MYSQNNVYNSLTMKVKKYILLKIIIFNIIVALTCKVVVHFIKD